jgi:hypothetical protein
MHAPSKACAPCLDDAGRRTSVPKAAKVGNVGRNTSQNHIVRKTHKASHYSGALGTSPHPSHARPLVHHHLYPTSDHPSHQRCASPHTAQLQHIPSDHPFIPTNTSTISHPRSSHQPPPPHVLKQPSSRYHPHAPFPIGLPPTKPDRRVSASAPLSSNRAPAGSTRPAGRRAQPARSVRGRNFTLGSRDAKMLGTPWNVELMLPGGAARSASGLH